MKLEGSSFLVELLREHYGAKESAPLRRAVLDSTYFIHPDVVAQTTSLPIVRCRRMASGERKNTLVDGEFVSDNFPPDYVFRAATSDTRDQSSTQLCHIYGGKGEARDVFFYTNLANLCLMPSFLAKLSDTDDAAKQVLKECAFVLYGFDPTGTLGGRATSVRCNEIKLATPPQGRLFDSLSSLKDARFLKAREAGYLFSARGDVVHTLPWVQRFRTAGAR